MNIFATFFAALPATIEQGLIYAVLAMGIMITYTILDFPDLTVDGSFPLGAAVTASLMLSGWHPIACLIMSALAGAAAGLATGLIHVKLKVRDLFSGVIVMTGLYAINLRIAGGSALRTIPRTATTIFRNNPLADVLPQGISVVAIALLIALIVKLLLDWFFTTRYGYLLRAAGDNERVVTSLARDKGNVKIAGLVIANALVALSGGILCQQQRLFEARMGTGTLVLGLASVIIGVNLFRGSNLIKRTTQVIIGAILYKACVSFAIACGMRPGDLKLITSALFLLILAAGQMKKKEKQYA